MSLMFSISSEEISFRFRFSPVTKSPGLEYPAVKQKKTKKAKLKKRNVFYSCNIMNSIENVNSDVIRNLRQ